MPALADQVVIVTGASAGIGAETVRRLAAAGARIVATARREDRLASLAREVDPTGERVVAVTADLTDDADRTRLVEEALSRFGRIDALVNNAGASVRGPLERVPLDDIRQMFETNLFAAIRLAQLVTPGMRERGSGRIVNIGSVAGRITLPLAVGYSASKHALESFSDGLRAELAPFGVQVVHVRPGYVATELFEAADRRSDGIDPGAWAPFVKGPRGRPTHRRVARSRRPGDRTGPHGRAPPTPLRHPVPRPRSPGSAQVATGTRLRRRTQVTVARPGRSRHRLSRGAISLARRDAREWQSRTLARLDLYLSRESSRRARGEPDGWIGWLLHDNAHPRLHARLEIRNGPLTSASWNDLPQPGNDHRPGALGADVR